MSWKRNISPIENYKINNIFPIEIIIHILILVFSTLQITILISKETNYLRNQEKIIYNKYQSNLSSSGKINRKEYYFNIYDILDSIKLTIDAYFNRENNSIEYIDYDKSSLKIEIDSFVNQYNTKHIEEIYSIVERNDYGPFSINKEDINLKKIKNNIINYKSFKISIKEIHFVEDFYYNINECYEWNIDKIFQKENRSTMYSYLSIYTNECKNEKTSLIHGFFNKKGWIHILVLFLNMYALFVEMSYIAKVAKYVFNLENNLKNTVKNYVSSSRSEDSEYYNPLIYESKESLNKNNISNLSMYSGAITTINNVNNYFSHQQDNRELSFNLSNNTKSSSYSISSGNHSEVLVSKNVLKHNKKNKPDKIILKNIPKLSELNLGWTFIYILSNMFLILGSLNIISYKFRIKNSSEISLGFGCLLAYIHLGSYLQYTNNYSSIYLTVNYAVPTVSRYLFGVMALFLGFTISALCILWKSENFSSCSSIVITLFSISQGDSILDIFQDVNFAGILGQLFIYAYSILFILVVMNLFIAILEESYVKSEMNLESHWTLDYQKEIDVLGNKNFIINKKENNQNKQIENKDDKSLNIKINKVCKKLKTVSL